MDLKESFELLKSDFPFYARNCLKIRTKDGKLLQFNLNKAQIHIHNRLEEQKAKTGRIRALIIKGRQQGCSTYVSGRFYHYTTMHNGIRTFILTHRKDATKNLYNLVLRYHDNLIEELRPSIGTKNTGELVFDEIDSSYGVGTSGGGDVGRSDTIQLLHGSECAFWDNTDKIQTGLMQTVADIDNTEIILESTANGIGNMFHKMVQAALRGDSEYQVIFTPWFWQDEYRLKLFEEFIPNEEELYLRDTYGLDDEQLSWRRNKIANYVGGIWQFKQEYPFSIEEAFQTSGEKRLFTFDSIDRAKNYSTVRPYSNRIIIGVDPAYSIDFCAISCRDNNVVYHLEKMPHCSLMEMVGRIVLIIKEHKPYKVVIDVGGLGIGVYSRLCELGYKSVCVAVNFGTTRDLEEPKKYTNKRAEMYGRTKEWLETELVKIEECKGETGNSLTDELIQEMLSISYDVDSCGKLKIDSKDDIKEILGHSPDILDSLVLTFAFNFPNIDFNSSNGILKVVKKNTLPVNKVNNRVKEFK